MLISRFKSHSKSVRFERELIEKKPYSNYLLSQEKLLRDGQTGQSLWFKGSISGPRDLKRWISSSLGWL